MIFFMDMFRPKFKYPTYTFLSNLMIILNIMMVMPNSITNEPFFQSADTLGMY
jgi:hypothetical protein